MSLNIIYGLIDPRNKELRYIGKSETGKARFNEHLKPSSLENDTHKDRWILQVLAANLKPEFWVIEEFDNPEVLFEEERFYIAYYRGLGCDLTNSTDGGDGTRGYKHKDETKVLLRESALKRDKTPYQNPHNKKKHIMVNDKLCRECPRCKTHKEIDNFGWDKSRNRFQGYCKECKRQYFSEWKEQNPSEILSEAEYNASRLPGARAGGEASKRPERRLETSLKRSKAIQGTHIVTGKIITFPSALKAKEAGFQNSNIGQAIKYNKPYREYIWTFVQK